MLRPACWINVDRHPAQCWPVSGFRHDGFAARVFGLNWRTSAGNLPTCRNGSAAIWVLIWLPLNRSQPLFMGRAGAVAQLYCLGWLKRRKNDDGASGRTVLVAVKSPLPVELKTFFKHRLAGLDSAIWPHHSQAVLGQLKATSLELARPSAGICRSFALVWSIEAGRIQCDRGGIRNIQAIGIFIDINPNQHVAMVTA